MSSITLKKKQGTKDACNNAPTTGNSPQLSLYAVAATKFTRFLLDCNTFMLPTHPHTYTRIACGVEMLSAKLQLVCAAKCGFLEECRMHRCKEYKIR